MKQVFAITVESDGTDAAEMRVLLDFGGAIDVLAVEEIKGKTFIAECPDCGGRIHAVCPRHTR